MKKKLKLFASLFSFVVSLAVLCFGVLAAVQVDYSVSGTVSYQVKDAYVKVNTSVFSYNQKMDLADLCKMVTELRETPYGTTPDGLTAVGTSTEYDSTSGEISGSYNVPNLSFSTQDSVYAYFFIVNIQNLGDNNVWAKMADTYTVPENVLQDNSALVLEIAEGQNTANIVIGIALDNEKQPVESAPNNYNFQILIGAGDLATDESNLAKLVFEDKTIDGTTYKIVKPNLNNDAGVVVIPQVIDNKTLTLEAGSWGNSNFKDAEYDYVYNECAHVMASSDYGYNFVGSKIKAFEFGPNGTSYIPGYMFESNNDLQKIIFDEDRTFYLGGQAIYNCANLRYISDFGLYWVGGYYSVSSCPELKHINLLETSTTTTLGGGFLNQCPKVESFTIPSSVTKLNMDFSNTGLKSITIPKGVTEMSSALTNNEFLETIIIEEDSQLATISYCFSASDNIKTVQYNATKLGFTSSSFVDGVLTINAMPESGNPEWWCLGPLIQSVVFAPLEGTTITKISDNCFYDASITNITIPSTATSIGATAFMNCVNLETITIPNGITEIGSSAFSGCNNLQDITYQATALGLLYSTFENGVLTVQSMPSPATGNPEWYTKNLNPLVTEVKFIEGANFPTIANNSFRNTQITSIVVPNYVTGINESAFQDCERLVSVTLPADLTTLGKSAFYSCASLKNIQLPSGIKVLDQNVFNSCPSLTSIILPAELTTINARAFAYTNLTSIIIPSKVNSIADGTIFTACDKLESIKVDSANATYTSSYNGTELNCIIGKNSHTLVAGCKGTNLDPIKDTSNFVTSIGNNAFNDRNELKNITIPESVTLINTDAFSSSGLTSIVIPKSVANLGKYAFNNCQSLTNITFDHDASKTITLAYSVFNWEGNKVTLNGTWSDGTTTYSSTNLPTSAGDLDATSSSGTRTWTIS